MTDKTISAKEWREVAETNRAHSSNSFNPAWRECCRVAAEHAEAMEKKAEQREAGDRLAREACERGDHWWGVEGTCKAGVCNRCYAIKPTPTVTAEDLRAFVNHYEDIALGRSEWRTIDSRKEHAMFAALARDYAERKGMGPL